MKKTIIIIALALVSLALNAKEITSSNGLTLNLDEVTGIYSIKGTLGIIPMGNISKTYETLLIMEKSFIEKKFSIGDPDYKVLEDKSGMYIIKVGLGGVKIRPEDVTKFAAAMKLNELGGDLSNAASNAAKKFKKYMK